jgi:hypothetical protein
MILEKEGEEGKIESFVEIRSSSRGIENKYFFIHHINYVKIFI